jgi:hypothetical protein
VSDATYPQPIQGHAGGHLREAFERVAEGGGLDETDDHYGQPLTEPLLMHLLSECTDIMPRLLCGALNLEPGSTYADGVAVLRAEDDVPTLLDE